MSFPDNFFYLHYHLVCHDTSKFIAQEMGAIEHLHLEIKGGLMKINFDFPITCFSSSFSSSSLLKEPGSEGIDEQGSKLT